MSLEDMVSRAKDLGIGVQLSDSPISPPIIENPLKTVEVTAEQLKMLQDQGRLVGCFIKDGKQYATYR